MKPSQSKSSGGGSRRLAIRVVIAFALTVAVFITSTGLSEHRARGIETATESITMAAIPAIDHVALARTELRHIEVLLDDFVYGHGTVGAPRLQEARKTFESEYTLYQRYAPYQGERELWGQIASSTDAMNASIDTILKRAQEGAPPDDELTARAKPAIERVDKGLVRAIELNGRNVQDLSNRITTIKSEARTWGIALDALGIVLAVIAASLVVRVVVGYVKVTEGRASELEHFAGRVAHDIRGPLQSVAMALDLTRTTSTDLPAKTRSRLERAQRSLQRVGQLVDGLLMFAKAGKRSQEGAHANVKDVVTGVTEDMRLTAEDKEIELKVEELSSWNVACDPGVLVSLVSNLVGNAVKYMGDAVTKRIDVRALRMGRMVRVEVSDTGPGVPPDLRGKIFDPYMRATASSVPGIGLGLATVRRLAEAHGGTVGVASNPGGGSLFWFELPVGATNETESLPPRQHPHEPSERLVHG